MCGSDWTCASRSNNLCETAASAALDRRLLPSLYSIALLFRMSSYFVRLYQDVEFVVRDNALVVRLPPPPGSAIYADELADYLLRSFISHQQHKRSERRPEVEQDDVADFEPDMSDNSPSVVEFKAAWLAFRSIFNGDLALVQLKHHCIDPGCCEGHQPSVSKRRMIESIRRLCFVTLPVVPNQGKWTKSAACIFFFAKTMCASAILQQIWEAALGKLNTVVTVQFSSEDDPALVQEVGWHAVVSKRVQKGGAAVRDRTMPTKLLMMAILLEPFRWLSGWLLHVSSPIRRARRGSWSSPPICLLSSPESSPVTRVLQYFSQLLAGSAGRLRLLYTGSNCSSFAEWAKKFPDLAISFRAGILVASSWLHQRIHAEATTWPWKLTQLVNPSLSGVQKSTAASQFMGAPLLTLDESFSAKLRSNISSEDRSP